MTDRVCGTQSLARNKLSDFDELRFSGVARYKYAAGFWLWNADMSRECPTNQYQSCASGMRTRVSMAFKSETMTLGVPS